MSNLPTVCFLTGTLNAFAGAERMTAVIANALAERGYRVLVLSLWDRASVFPLHEGVEHHALFEQRPSFKREYFSTVLGIRRFVRKHGIDVLIEVDTMLTLFTLPATFGMKVRRIAWEHCHFDEDLGRKARRVARWLAGRFDDAVVVLTERDREQWERNLELKSGIVAIPNPLPFAFPDTPVSTDARSVLAVGRLIPAKGFDVLLAAWKQVAPSFPEWRLTIVGEGPDRTALEAQIRQDNLSTSVSLPGSSSNVEAYYKCASVFCLSSRYEGFALVLVEAMSFGLPIVSTDCDTGPRELIRPEENGILVSSGDPTKLAAGLMRLMSDQSLRARLGQNARAGARKFDFGSIEARWRSVIGGPVADNQSSSHHQT